MVANPTVEACTAGLLEAEIFHIFKRVVIKGFTCNTGSSCSVDMGQSWDTLYIDFNCWDLSISVYNSID
ncbi:hypothetical protein ABEB36_009095 [Hypothenemus hampei]|uniref:Uncharacterized protein n=1 Tax=Hypothenemus hampei TaxID=57062 RepID=A0ABD1EP64_HYPHA